MRKSGANVIVCPAFVDVHVHLREPGRPDKETIRTGSLAAASAGYTCICPMPNLDPVPDCRENLEQELELIRRDACIQVLPYASITMGRKGLETVDFESLKDSVVAFSDDGSGVQDSAVMLRAMESAKALDCILAAHCEDNRYGTSPESEWKQIERDLELAARTGCAYHVCHISTARSVEIIRQAKRSGVDVSCETAPHYLLLTQNEIRDEGRFKMNPPLRMPDDRDALIQGLLDGTIDMIATDHAPHTAAEKSLGLQGSANGIVGLETAFPVLYTYLVRKGVITLERLVELMSTAPRKRFRLGEAPLDTATMDLDAVWTIDSSRFRSMGHSTPFDGWEVYGRCLETRYKGKTVYAFDNE